MRNRYSALMKVIVMACALCASSASYGLGDSSVLELDVSGVTRQAIVFAPKAASTSPSPLVFAFHGHGGTMRSAADSFNYQGLWPEAIVAYMQGLPTAQKLTDPEGLKSGWESSPGEEGDRDIAFFDKVLSTIKAKYKVDEKRIYAVGHSNGGSFTYLLWALRGDTFAAVAESSSIAAGLETQKLLRPKPLFKAAGKRDPIVKFAWQQAMIDYVIKLNGCGSGTTGWGGNALCELYPSKDGTPVVTYVHNGGHEPPKDMYALVVAFFKEH